MYCPVCFNDTLKMASSGVVRVTFNKKSRNTSQFYYNITTEKPEEITKKFRDVAVDYFDWYSTFQNQDEIQEYEVISSDFKCTNNCKISMDQKLTVENILITKEKIIEIIKEVSSKYDIGTKF